MAESSVINALDTILKEVEGTGFDNAISVVAKLIENRCGTVLSDKQIKQCITLCTDAAIGNTSLFEQLLIENGLTIAKIEKIEMCANFIANIDDVLSLCDNVYNVFDMVNRYMTGDKVMATEMLSGTLNTLSDIVGFLPNCGLVSSILSLGADLLDKGAELVSQRVELYNELDAVLESVMNGTSSDAEETQVKDMYATVKAFEESGCSDAIRLYQCLMNQYGWIFDLAGIDTTQLNEYNTEMTSIQNTYNDLSSKMSEIEKIDIDHDGIISNQEIEINVQQIETSEKSQKYDPIIIDLNKNGKFTSDTENGVHFDYSGDGFAEKTAWVEAGDGLLVYDKNGNGINVNKYDRTVA